ncbi:MAG: DUF6694 family lipoprotein [Longimicrobiales bacterium]
MEEVTTQMAASPDSVAFATAILGVMGKSMFSSFGASLASSFSGFDEDAPSVSTPALDTLDVKAAMCSAMAGLTGPEIIAAADSIATMLETRLEENVARKHLQLLTEAQSKAEAVRDSLAGFEILSSRLRQRQGYIGLEATIELHVRNGTNHPISRAYFAAIAATPGRAVPWIEEDFNHSIPGGLEPGEEAQWRLAPQMYQGDWTSVRVPPEATFEVRVVKLDGADGEALWGGPMFTKGDQLLLDSLRVRFGAAGT